MLSLFFWACSMSEASRAAASRIVNTDDELPLIPVMPFDWPGGSSRRSASQPSAAGQDDAIDSKLFDARSCESLTFTASELIMEASKWCNLTRLPPGTMPPKKLQGLFWMKDYMGSDVAYCGNLGRWNPDTLTLTLPITEAFVFYNNPAGKLVQTQSKGVNHRFFFSSDKLNSARVIPGPGAGGAPHNKVMMTTFGHLGEFALEEDGDTNGTHWKRTNKFGGVEGALSKYTVVKLLDGKLRNVSNNPEKFITAMESNWKMKHGVSVMKCQ